MSLASRTMARLSWGYGEHNGERGLPEGLVGARGSSEPGRGAGGQGPGPRTLSSDWKGVGVHSPSLEKLTAVPRKLKRSEVR